MTQGETTGALARLERVAIIGTRALSVLGLFALMVLAFITLANGLLRWAFNSPIAGVVDVGGLAIAIAVSCCIPISMMERSHITFRMVSSSAPRSAAISISWPTSSSPLYSGLCRGSSGSTPRNSS